MKDIKQTILLTGGTGSIGLMLLKTLPQLNYKIFFTSRSQEKIIEIEESINKELPEEIKIKGIKVDLTSENYLNEISSFFKIRNIFPNALINNARALETLEVNNGYSLRKNFIGEFLMGVIIPYELSMMISDNNVSFRKIINISSMYGVVPPNSSLYIDGYESCPIQYGVTKAGLIHLTKELAVRLAKKNVQVNCISYGGVEGRADEAFVKRYSQATPTGRMLKKTEVSGPIKFLLSDDSSGMTGHNIIFDGGYTVW